MAYFKDFLTKKEVWNLSSHVVETIQKDGKPFQEVITKNSDRMDIFAGSIYYMFEDDKLFFLVVDYKPDGGSRFVKFPGGISLAAVNEKIVETCIRESQEECGFKPVIQNSELIYWKYSKADHRNCHHWKTFFLHHKKTGSLRSVRESDHGENSPAYWLEVEDVAAQIHYAHWEGCKRAIERVCNLSEQSSDIGRRTACYYANEALKNRQKQMDEFFALRNQQS